MRLPADLFKRLRLLIAFEIDSLDLCLGRLKAEDYPTDVAVDFIDALQQSLDSHRKVLQYVSTRFSKDPTGAVARLQSERRKLAYEAEFVAFIENARTRNVPWSLVPAIESVFEILSPDEKLLVSCLYDSTYATCPTSVGQFRILFVPALHRLDPYLHVLIGHELFHPLVADFIAWEQVAVLDRIRVAYSSRFGQKDKRADTFIERMRATWQSVMQELTCDMGCAALFGPAALFAITAWGSKADWDEAPLLFGEDPYPPYRYRIRAIIEHALKDGSDSALDRLLRVLSSQADTSEFSTVLRTHLELLKEEVANTMDMDRIDQDPYLEIVFEQVESSLPRAWAYAEAKAAAFTHTWSSALHEVPTLVRSLRDCVPPGEVQPGGAPASVASIMVAAWLFDLWSRSKDSRDNDNLSDYLRSCRLVFKAIEDSTLKNYFLSERDSGNGSPDKK